MRIWGGGATSKGNNNKAFTLAEVIITIAIIGVVAAISLPTLMTKIRTTVERDRYKVMTAKLIQGLNQYNIMEDGFSREYSNTEEFVRGLSKHMKIAQICGKNNLSDCMGTTKIYYEKNGVIKDVDLSTITTAKKLQLKTSGFLDPAGMILGDGTPMIVSWNNNCTKVQEDGSAGLNADHMLSSIPVSCIDGLYDNNGTKLPNTFAKDIQSFGSAKLGSLCLVELPDGTCVASTATIVPTPMSKSDCEANKSKYGIKDCNYDLDYWAGAVKYCHDQGMRLPTQDELTKLASYLYNKQISSTGTTYATLDSSKLPATLSGLGSAWYLWSGEEASANGAYRRNFYASGSSQGAGSNRFNSDLRAMCVGD